MADLTDGALKLSRLAATSMFPGSCRGSDNFAAVRIPSYRVVERLGRHGPASPFVAATTAFLPRVELTLSPSGLTGWTFGSHGAN